MLWVNETNSSNFKMWLIDSRQQQDRTSLFYKHWFCYLNLYWVKQKSLLLQEPVHFWLISIGDVHMSIALNVKAKGSHSATLWAEALWSS